MRRTSAALVFAQILACGPGNGDDSAASTTGGTTGSTSGDASGQPPTSSNTASTTHTDTSTSTGADISTGTADSGETGPSCVQRFAFDISFGSTCDVLLQDCPCDRRCAPVGEELHCVAGAAEPVGVGEACTVGVPGGDDCVAGSTCVGPGFNDFSRCVALCDGLGAGCPADTECIPGPGVTTLDYGLCMRPCDPLAPACGEAEECSRLLPGWFGDTTSPFVCMPAGESAEVFTPCNLPIDCAAGHTCTGETPGPCGADVEFGCCTPLCALDGPTCPDALTCQPFSANPPAGFEHIGVCLDP